MELTKKFVDDIHKMFRDGSLNDVKIKLSDGEIAANKDVLMARSEYFKTMFNNNNFVESQTSCVDMIHCSKVIMDKIVTYFFSGKMEINELNLAQMLKLTSMLGMLMLDEEMKSISDFIITCLVEDRGVNSAFLPELISGLVLAEKLALYGPIMDALVEEIIANLKVVPHIPDVVLDSEVFKSLPFELVRRILAKNMATNKTGEKFDAFVFWRTKNQLTDQEKSEIVNCFIFEDFTADELLTTVKMSGLYKDSKIDERMRVIIKNLKRKIKERDDTIFGLIQSRQPIWHTRRM